MYRLFSIAFLFFAASSTSEGIDLSRTTPVPSDQPIPVEDFFRPFLLRRPALNPNGTVVAANVSDSEGNFQMSVMTLKSSEGFLLENEGDKDVDEFHWLDDRHLVYFLSYGKWHRLALMALDIDHPRNSYPLLQRCDVSLLAIPPKDPLHPLVWLERAIKMDSSNLGGGSMNFRFFHEEQGPAILKFTPSSTSAVIEPGKVINSVESMNVLLRDNDLHLGRQYPKVPRGEATWYFSDADGNPTWAEGVEPTARHLSRWKDDHWEPVTWDPKIFRVLGPGTEKTELLVQEEPEPGAPKGPRRVRLWNSESRTFGKILWEDPDYDFVGYPLLDPYDRTLLGVTYCRSRQEVLWLDPFRAALQTSLNAKYPGLSVTIESLSRDRTVVLYSVSSERLAPMYYLFYPKTGETTLFRKAAPWLDPNRLRPTKPFRFPTRDGHQLEAFLTLPSKISREKPVALVVLPHGGPHAQDSVRFDPLVQFLVSRGYAVLQPNYRGSLGLSSQYSAEEGDDFTGMSNDVTDAVRCVIGTGFVDTDRIAILGWSFGGYLAVSGVEKEPELYRCAVSLAGVFDWSKINPRFDAASLLGQVSRIRVPVFVGHGKEDVVVDVSQSRSLLKALDQARVPHEQLFLSDEGHGSRHLASTVELYTKIEAFLATNLKPRTKAGADFVPSTKTRITSDEN